MFSESTPIEGIYIELHFRKKNHLDVLKKSLDSYFTKYDKLMVIGGLNAKVNLECMKLFRETYDQSSLIKVPTCYKNPEKPSCIDLP